MHYRYILYKLIQVAGEDNVTHIPIYQGDVFETRLEMFGEMFEIRTWSNVVADEIAKDLENNPLQANQALIIVGDSGGGTIAIEALDLLAEKDIFVDQVILRGSPVQENELENVGRVDYITSQGDPYYSWDSNPNDAVDVIEHVLDFEGHVPPDNQARAAVGNLIAHLANQARAR